VRAPGAGDRAPSQRAGLAVTGRDRAVVCDDILTFLNRVCGSITCLQQRHIPAVL